MTLSLVLILIASVCGGVGAVARQYILNRTAHLVIAPLHQVNAGMLCVNALGCATAAAWALVAHHYALNPTLVACVSVGVLGGFTSFSTPAAQSAHIVGEKTAGKPGSGSTSHAAGCTAGCATNAAGHGVQHGVCHATAYTLIMLAVCSAAYALATLVGSCW